MDGDTRLTRRAFHGFSAASIGCLAVPAGTARHPIDAAENPWNARRVNLVSPSIPNSQFKDQFP